MIYFLIFIFVGLAILAHLDGKNIVRRPPTPTPAPVVPTPRTAHRGTVIARWYHLGWQVSRINHPHTVEAARRWADVVLLEASIEIDSETINRAIEAGARVKS